MASMHWEGAGSESIMPSQEDTSLEATQSGYCDSCPFGRPPNQRADDWHGFLVDYEAVKESAQRGHCQACAGIVEFLKAQEQEPIKLVYRYDNYNGMRLFLVSSEEDDYRRCPVYEFFVKNEEPVGGITPMPYWDDAFGEIDWMRIPSGDTCSTAAFEALGHWISRCKAEHTKCQPADKKLPHRVLEIVETEPLHIRLVENCTQQADYACLSHRWGPQTKPSSLVKENLDLYRAEIPEVKLYPLVRDALEAIIRLGLRFIWIDCYCIIQDDPVDWEVEATNMASIYENAVLTISATFSEDGCSLFSTMSKEFKEFQVTQIRGVSIHIRKQLPHPCVMQYGQVGDSEIQEKFHGPSLSRGWVFQERLLSSRFIHFTSSEIFWECRESTWCECSSREPYWAGLRRQAARTIDEQGWDLIADQYNSTQLSFEKDRLPAIAGVARRYGELNGGLTYLAGLWQEELPAALAWFKPGGGKEERPLEQIAPSWSWTSLPRGMLLLLRTETSFVRVVGVRINPPGADVYMGAKWAELTVEGPMMDLEVYKHSDRVMIGRHGNAFLKIEADFKTDPDDDTKFRSVPDGSKCLLLLMLDGREEFYYFQLYGIVLLQQSSGVHGEDPKFERIGYFGTGARSEIFYVDDSGDYEYCGGNFPSTEDPEDDVARGPPIHWFLDRAETRQVTLV